ncbi:rhomboid family intramembrane serine protease [Winogradskyella alexanderae]|uniref:Rhomboid family intramembrane serine protease n=1 Tax=Winogradskyella alexanderae TaxID=2877123 RepID=A0ABS7XQH1_9FLAO|nr:rhomboid family intramembrane serine protease [Winogradskyella alexanderae]MCA0132257.1 rhomboid family intramembrane serine protease [Winogradskyella alexanderae]
MSSFQDLKFKYRRLDIFGKIIVINAIIFILSFVLSALLKWNIAKYFVLPSDFMDVLMQPWSLITYGFFHSGFWHIVFNMLLLFYLARVATNIFRPKMVLNVYFMGILFGGLSYLIVANVIPTDFFRARGVLLGSSAGVSALLMFVAVYMPDTQIRLFNAFNVKWKHIAVVFVTYDIFRLLLGLNQGGYIAHLGGYLLGYLYASNLLKGKDIGAGFERLMDTFVGWFKPKSKLKTVHRRKGKSGYTGKTKKEFETFNKQKKIDMILDKISKSGYDSLTTEEKEFLFKAGQD